MDKMRMESVDITDQNIEKIGALFPNVITETKNEKGEPAKAINFELLKQELSKEIVDGDETYEFTWVGKKAAIVEANKPIRKTLRPCKEESVNWDTTENLYIEGDNLEVLKLLQESYLSKVKMIYIDPPYNTGNDFIYEDDFAQSREDYDEDSGAVDENGDRMFKNTDSNGRFHSDWCSMIYSRLALARNILCNDGVIFISIDDNEIENMKNICNEVFGEENFIAQFIWEKTFRPSNFTRTTRKNSEYVLCYSKKRIELQGVYEDSQGDFSLTKKKHNAHILKFPANYVNANFPDGVYQKGDYNNGYELLTDITVKDGVIINSFDMKVNMSIWSQDHLDVEIKNGVYLVIKNPATMVLSARKTYKQNELKPTTLIPSKEVGDVLEANKDLKQLLGNDIFDYPKPVSLIKHLCRLIKDSSDITILDFFSGSATTAHAVMQLNAEDGGKRRFIMVQLSERCATDSAAYKAGYKNICEIGKERIRRAAKKIHEQYPDVMFDDGFRVLKVDDSNMTDVYYSADSYDQNMLDQLESNIKADRTDLDLLFGCLLEWGLPLSMPYTSENIEGCTIHTYNDGDLIACFNSNIPESVIKEIAKRKPLRAVFRDSGFKGSPEKINVGETFKLLSPDTRVKII